MTTLAGLQVSEAELSLVYQAGERNLGFLIYTLATSRDSEKGTLFMYSNWQVSGKTWEEEKKKAI